MKRHLAAFAFLKKGPFKPLKLCQRVLGQFQAGGLEALPYLLAANFEPCENDSR